MQDPIVYNYRSYKTYVRELVKSRPHGGRGTFRQMAEHLQVHSTLISQVFRGTKNLLPEQAYQAAEFLKLDAGQLDYFLTLVEYERTTFGPLKERLEHRLDLMRQQSQLVKNRISPTHTLSDEVKARFYSSWHYAAIRLSTDIPTLQNAASIAKHFGLPQPYVEGILEFLVANGLVVQDRYRYKMGPARTHIDYYSPFLPGHHRNWRLKACERHAAMTDAEVAFSGPMTLSAADFRKIKEMLLTLVQNVDRTVRDSPSEVVAFLNIDFLTI